MHYLSRSALCAGIAGIFILIGTSPALAAETAASEIVIIPEGDTVTEDLYAVGSRVVVEGTIEGDLIAFAAEEVIISGQVTGNVQAVAPTVTVGGEVAGSVRFTANRLTISGSIGGDLVGASVRAELSPESTIDGDVVVWAFRLVAAGTIGTDLEGTQRTLELAGSVGGDVDVSVNQLIVTGPLEVAGDLGYRSPSEAEGMDQATVGGVVAHKTPLPPNIRVRALGLAGPIPGGPGPDVRRPLGRLGLAGSDRICRRESETQPVASLGARRSRHSLPVHRGRDRSSDRGPRPCFGQPAIARCLRAPDPCSRRSRVGALIGGRRACHPRPG